MTPTEICLILTLFILVLFVIRIIKVLVGINNNIVTDVCGNHIKTMIILGSGGHTGEMIKIVSELNFEKYIPRTYVIASTDSMSSKKVEQLESEKKDEQFNLYYIPRSREVGQSWVTSVFSTFSAFLRCLIMVFNVKPDLILCNGPGSCVPVCLAGLLLRILKICNARIIFIESICRVKSLSLSGKILYYICDDIFVQWSHLLRKYPKAKYYGRLV